MAEPVLYSFRRCPYAMRARMALHISGLEKEHREVVLRDKPAAMLEASPKGTVPVLVTDDGTVLEESLDIMRWALGKNDPEGWLERQDVELLEATDGPFKHHLDRYKYYTRYEDADPLEHRAQCLDHLKRLNDRLEGQPNLCGEQRGFADIAIFPFVRQCANHDREWFEGAGIANVAAWLERHVTSDLFAAIMTKYPKWEPEAA